MFTLNIEGKELTLLLKIDETSDMPLERLARLALFKGLRLLRSKQHPTPWSSARIKPLKEVQTYIREHWLTQTDEEMAAVLGYSVFPIQKCRNKMCLTRPKGRPKGSNKKPVESEVRKRTPISQSIDRTEFEYMVTQGGYTMTDYAREKGLVCSRERLRQIAVELSIKHSPSDRTAEWFTARNIRQKSS